MADIAQIAARLSAEGYHGLRDCCGCDCGNELVRAGLWEPDPAGGQRDYLSTCLGRQVRAYIKENPRG